MRARGYEQVDSNAAPQRKSFIDYSWKCCTLFGIPIHIHYLMPLFFVLSFVFWARVIAADSAHFAYYFFLICLQNLVLWETVLVHELGHCLAGWLVGGHTDKVVLWPLGGLAFTAPPLGSSNSANNGGSRRCSQIIISLGGPFTHIPHMMIYGGVLYWIAQNPHDNIVNFNPFARQETWNEVTLLLFGLLNKISARLFVHVFREPAVQTIYTPIELWADYDFFMLAFTLNFYLFVVNLLLPVFPLDGSKIFVNIMRNYFTVTKTGYLYCVVNAILSIGFIAVSYAWLKNGSMLQFAGLWGMFQVYVMSQYIMQGREHAHPLIHAADNNL